MITKKEEISDLIKSIVNSDERVLELEKLLEKEVSTLKIISQKMSGNRNSVLNDVELKITELLKQLGMPNAKFRITLSQMKDFTPTGLDQADFFFSANKQVAPENLAKIASGGELSRVMLSLKSLLTKIIIFPQ